MLHFPPAEDRAFPCSLRIRGFSLSMGKPCGRGAGVLSGVRELTYNEKGGRYSTPSCIINFSEASSMGGPALLWVDPNGIFVGSIFGLIIALPVSLFLAFWVSAVKNKAVVVLGAFIGAILGFLIILGW